MRIALFICGMLLFTACARLPIGYYMMLRIAVAVGAGLVIINEYKNGFSLWVVVFGLIAIIFNPLVPVYLQKKAAWIPIENDESFKKKIPEGYTFHKKIGITEMKIDSKETTLLDDHHTITKVHWNSFLQERIKPVAI